MKLQGSTSVYSYVKAPRSRRTKHRARHRARAPLALRDLRELVASSPAVVAHISELRLLEPDLVLLGLALYAKICWVDSLTDSEVVSWITAQNTLLGRAGTSMAPGYYLFVDGRARVYDSGIPDPTRDQIAFGMSAAVVLIARLTQDVTLAHGAAVVVQGQAALRVMSAFLPYLPKWTSPPPPASARPTRGSKSAYDILGVSPLAPRAEVKARYRILAKQWHPDRCDEIRQVEAEQRMIQINRAYAEVCEARRW